jgi:hypothetical protein
MQLERLRLQARHNDSPAVDVPVKTALQCKLLHRHTGITPANVARCAWLYDILFELNKLMVLFQTSKQPIQHKVAKAIRDMRSFLKTNYNDVDLDGNPDDYKLESPMLEEWEEQLLKKHKGKRSLPDAKRLVRKMEIEGQTFANRVLTLLKGDSGLTCRTTVLYMAFEMIKIDCPDKTLKDPGAIAARKVLCQGWKLDYSKVEKELTAIRGYIRRL